MDAETQVLLESILQRPARILSRTDRNTLDSLVAMAMVSDSAMDELKSVLANSRQVRIGGWLGRQWNSFKAVRWGIPSLTKTELWQCLSNIAELDRLRETIRLSIDRGSAGRWWWHVRLAAADQFIEQSGLKEAHSSAVECYARKNRRT